MKQPLTAIFLANLLKDAGENGLTRKEMVTALLLRNGRKADDKARRGYGSVGFFTIGSGVGGVYWAKDETDGRWRLTELGHNLLKGQIATKEQREAIRKAHWAKMAEWRKAHPLPPEPMAAPALPQSSQTVIIRGVSVPLREAQDALEMAPFRGQVIPRHEIYNAIDALRTPQRAR